MSADFQASLRGSGVDVREIHIREPGPGATQLPPIPPLPDRYGQDRLLLLPRDPFTLFATWELSGGILEWTRARLGADGHAGRLALRLLEGEVRRHGLPPPVAAEFDVEGCHSWYLHGARPGAIYSAQLGLRIGDRFIPLIHSLAVPLPPAGESDVVDAEWLTIEEIRLRSLRGHHAGSSPGVYFTGGV